MKKILTSAFVIMAVLLCAMLQACSKNDVPAEDQELLENNAAMVQESQERSDEPNGGLLQKINESINALDQKINAFNEGMDRFEQQYYQKVDNVMDRFEQQIDKFVPKRHD